MEADSMIFALKTQWCPREDPHQWCFCPFVHQGEMRAPRRDPRSHSADPCPFFRSARGRGCTRGYFCNFAHGIYEVGLHPSKYRTRMCLRAMAGTPCNRFLCFFAHSPAELRQPPGVVPWQPPGVLLWHWPPLYSPHPIEHHFAAVQQQQQPQIIHARPTANNNIEAGASSSSRRVYDDDRHGQWALDCLEDD